MNLLRVTNEGALARQAIDSMQADGAAIAASVRRALPFFAKPGYRVSFVSAAPGLLAESIAKLPGPAFVTHIDVTPSGSLGALVFDRQAVTLIVDGLLGGTSGGQQGPYAPSLSGAQSALMRRVSAGVVEAISRTLRERAGITLAPRPAAAGPVAQSGQVISTWELASERSAGTLLLALARDAALCRVCVDAPHTSSPDPGVLAAFRQVELELRVELGRVRVPLEQLAKLGVGSTLVVDTPVGGAVDVRVDGHTLLTGQPTTDGGRIAVRIKEIGHGS
jgi:flagellar motor switch protein FliN/FliY